MPGNLIFFEGHVVSQGPTELVVYPQLESEQKRVDALLKKNPDDPEGRARRGELRLDRGDLPGAVDDLRAALKQKDKLPEGVGAVARAKDKLHEALTEFLQRDFDAAEKFLGEYEQLCKVDDNAERARRVAGYHVLVGRGREKQGKYVEAVRAYLYLADVGAGEALMEVSGEPGLKVVPAVWMRSRVDAILQRAPADQRKKIEEELAARLKRLP